MEYGLIIVAFLCVVSILDKRQHNDKLRELFPDENDRKQSDIRRELENHMYLEVLFLIGSVIALAASFIGKLVK